MILKTRSVPTTIASALAIAVSTAVLITIVVPSVILDIVVPGAIPTPVTKSPTAIPVESATVNVVSPTAAAPPKVVATASVAVSRSKSISAILMS